MYNIQEIFHLAYDSFRSRYNPSEVQRKAASAILDCKTGRLGCNRSICEDCGHTETHNNSCRNRNCPCCQEILKELWIDARKAEVIDAPYFHVVFTLPAQLNPLIYANQPLLYSLMHRCVSETLLELAADKKYLGATPGIIQILHTWGQELNFHPHIHCIITGAGLTKIGQLRKCSKKFFLPVRVLGKKFRGKFMSKLQKLHQKGELQFSGGCLSLRNSYEWTAFCRTLYNICWIPYIKETFNGFGNAFDYLGRYTHRIAISNSRIQSVTDTKVTFTAKDYKTGTTKLVTLSPVEFLRRFLMHVLPSSFQKIRYYGFLNNCSKKKNLVLLARLTGKTLFRPKLASLGPAELLQELWGINIRRCPVCGECSMRYAGKTYPFRN